MTHYEQCCARECQYCALGLRRTTPIQNVGGRLEYSTAYHAEVNDDGLEIAIPCTAPTLAEFAERCAEALRELVDMYVANKGTKYEFITCITPPVSSQMSVEQRAKSKTWKAWDNAREALAALERTAPADGGKP